MRPSRRAPDELRAVSLERGVVKYAEGSCLVKFGDTHVLVTATLEDRLPPWLKGQGRGWVTAEYGMLPRATLERTRREASAGMAGAESVSRRSADRYGAATSSGIAAFSDREIRRWFLSTSRTLTRTSCPTCTISPTLRTRCGASSEMCTNPSMPGSSSTKAPKSISRVTFPLATVPGG